MHRLATVLLTLAAAGCGGGAVLDPPVYATLDAVFSLDVGEQATIEGAPFLLRFENVPEDYRCPTDVECVWAGDARVRLVIVADGAGEPLELHTNLEPRATVVRGFRITLERLDPAPHSETPIPASAYIAELRVTRVP